MIYFDNAATTPLLPEVIDKMSETMKTTFGNPSSLHTHGRMASKLLRESREQIAQSLHTLPNRIFFTSGGSESNNTVIKGLLPETPSRWQTHHNYFFGTPCGSRTHRIPCRTFRI